MFYSLVLELTLGISHDVTSLDPIERNMVIPLQMFAEGSSCHSMRFGVHERWVKAG